MNQPDDDDLLRLVSEAFDEDLGEPPQHLTHAAKALRPGRSRFDATAEHEKSAASPARTAYRLERRLAAAAANSSRRLEATYSSGDGRVSTEVVENEEGRLQVTLRSADASVLYVAMAWTPIGADGVGRRSRLVTPLAVDRWGVSIQYDLGSIEDAEAVDIEPAEPLAETDVVPDDLAVAFKLIPTGASRRAWARVEAVHRANGDPLADLIAAEIRR